MRNCVISNYLGGGCEIRWTGHAAKFSISTNKQLSSNQVIDKQGGCLSMPDALEGYIGHTLL